MPADSDFQVPPEILLFQRRFIITFFSLFVTLALPATFVYCVKTSKDMAIIAMECE